MIPVLYNKLGQLKIGNLTNTISAYVTEERNGEFELELTYPASYPYSDSLVEENIIVVDGNDTLKAQKFRIYMVKKFMSSEITVWARHISFDLAYDYINSIDITNQSCEYCLNQLFRNSQFSTQYKGYSDIINAQDYKVSQINILSAIGGTKGSILDTFGTGAEILRDNTNIHVLNSRGYDNGVTIEYRKNLTGFELEEDNTDLVTRIQGYAKYTPEGGVETVVETGWIDSPLINNYSHPYCQRIDFSENFQDGDIPTVAKLTTLISKKYSVSKVDIPKMNYKIEFIPLSKCGYEGIEDKITLCDKVTIIDSRYGINTQAKVIKVVFDVLRERYDSMELGEPKTTLTDVIGGGDEGPIQGPPGPSGKDGTSIRILGSYNSYEELVAAHQSGNTSGDAYIIQGDLWVWDGSKFENIGKFQGQDGVDGTNGVSGKDGVSIIWKGTFSSHPSNPQNGWAYYNSVDKKSYVYQSGTWYQMSIDGTDGIDGVNGANGISIIWKGESATPPANPQLNWCYRDTDNGVIYIWNGKAWEVMVLDGTDGADGTNGQNGMSVYISYHDSLTLPAKPTGNGTTGGWHTNATSAVVWMSQKVSANSTSGTWGEPIKIKGQDGADGEPGPQGPPGEEFPNTLPNTPVVTVAVYGFGSIEINWTFASKVYYTYEVYASKTNNFVPNSMDLIHEGQTSSFLFQAQPNETWYFRVCVKNSYGNRTAFSTQVSATTPLVSDLANYVNKLAIGDALIGTLNLERGWVGQLKGNWIDAKQLSVTDSNGKRTLDIDSFGNVNLDCSSLKINAGAVAKESQLTVLENKILAKVESVESIVLNENLVINGDFAINTNDWVKVGPTITRKVNTATTKPWANIYTTATVGEMYAYTEINTIANEKHKLSFKLAQYSSTSTFYRARLQYLNSSDVWTTEIEWTGNASETWNTPKIIEYETTTVATKYRIWIGKLDTERIDIYVTDFLFQRINDIARKSEIEVLDDKISSKVSVGEVKSTIEQNPDSIQIGFNKINNFVEITTASGIKVNHSDGSYTRMNSDGISRYISGQAKEYKYITYTKEITLRKTDVLAYTMSGTYQDYIPSEYRIKGLQTFISIAEYYAFDGQYEIGGSYYDKTMSNTITRIMTTNPFVWDISTGRYTFAYNITGELKSNWQLKVIVMFIG